MKSCRSLAFYGLSIGLLGCSSQSILTPELYEPLYNAPPEVSSCWDELSALPGFPDSSLGISVGTSTSVAFHNNDLWVAWTGHGKTISDRLMIYRLVNKKWEKIEPPQVPEDRGGNDPKIVITKNGTPLLAWDSAGKGKERTQSKIFTATYANGIWVEVDEALNGFPEPFSHAHMHKMKLSRSGTPVISWMESPAEMKERFLFLAEWVDGEWVSIGKPVRAGGYGYEPYDFVQNAQGEYMFIWLHDYKATMPQGVRWTGNEWVDLNRQEIADVGYSFDLRPASLLNSQHGGYLVAWDGVDAKDDTNLYLVRTGQGEPLVFLSRFHVEAAATSVGDISVAEVGDRHHVLVFEEELTRNRGAKVRVVKTRDCKKGEDIKMPPDSIPASELWPKTVQAAVDSILADMSEKNKDVIRNTKEDDLIQFHFGWGTGIRNAFGLWAGNDELIKSCLEYKSYAFHPDDCSGVIIEEVWKALQTKD